ncbi:3060_t:CDS:2 [Diversispora eburnea]|uniref:3060_t:CDS:1 n=1 Tax=Diversispora eburnea TaxID=1213867 RepID=A0A9N8V6U7_9GLOM|nr:3060_t:CDS:2 [Diversispora eburnea]
MCQTSDHNSSKICWYLFSGTTDCNAAAYQIIIPVSEVLYDLPAGAAEYVTKIPNTATVTHVE